VGKKVIYYIDQRGSNPVWSFICSLPIDERDKCFEYITYLEEKGEEVKRPIGDYIGRKLYELRPKQTRILYFFMFKNFAVLVHAFRKKSNKIPEQEIKLAQKRMEEFLLRVEKNQIQLGDKIL